MISCVTLVDSVRAGLAQLGEIDPRDQACADLAVLYAEAIDAIDADPDGDSKRWQDRQRDPLAELGPKLLQCLIQLGLTPAARKGIVGDKPEAQRKSPLDELRERRAARAT